MVAARDLPTGQCDRGPIDVVVCDGFVGNVALKTCEGTAKMLSIMLKESLKSTVTSQVGALLSRKAFMAFKVFSPPGIAERTDEGSTTSA